MPTSTSLVKSGERSPSTVLRLTHALRGPKVTGISTTAFKSVGGLFPPLTPYVFFRISSKYVPVGTVGRISPSSTSSSCPTARGVVTADVPTCDGSSDVSSESFNLLDGGEHAITAKPVGKET